MNTSRLLIATACSLAVAGAVGVAFAQNTTPTTPEQNAAQGSGQMQGQTPSTAAPGTMNPTTTPGTGSTGTAAPLSTDGTLRTQAERDTMDAERAARADRN